MLRVECERRNTDPAVVKGSLDHDPIGYFSVNGNFFGRSEQLSFKEAKNNIEFARRYIPHFRVVTVNGQYFSNSGSSILQELAFSLAAGNDYLSILTGLDLSVDDVASSIRFNFAIGADYFMEIARLRAARLLWAKIVEAYGTQNAESMKMSLHTFTSRWYKTIYDPHVNMLRATTEAMASVIGGSDSLTVEPFDNVHKDPNEFSVRYSRNIQNICREEAYLGKVIDPAAGSYYVESLTHSFVNEAWKYFIEIQESGGYTEAFKAGLIQREISTLAGQRDMNIAMRKEILLGTNQYPIIMEKAGNINVREQHKEKGSEIIAEPLKPYRGAKAFEELRRRTELSGRIPNVFLFPFGNLAMQKARANFASNFFGCAGFRIIDNTGFRSLDSGIATAGKSKADIVVLCSSDDEYAAAVPVIWEKLKDKTIVVVAGYPQNLIEEFSRLGLKYFIHIRSNVLETLKDFQEELGI
jgi:methylmalonyl-CoA mutase